MLGAWGIPRSARLASLVAILLVMSVGCAREDADPAVRLYRTLHPTVVLLTMRIPAEEPARRRRGELDDAYGSGVVIASGRWGSRILTAAHVVADARGLRARVGDRRTVAAKVVATSDDALDLATVEIPVPGLSTVALGDPARLAPGRAVAVLGYPIPDAFSDERLGTVASLRTGRIASIRTGAIELDLPVIPGESGGPVVDLADGALLGIAASRFEDEPSIGFAIPVDAIRRFLATGRAKKNL